MGFDDSKSREYQLCPSILSADFNRLGEQIQMLERAGVKWLHIDVMDIYRTLWSAARTLLQYILRHVKT